MKNIFTETYNKIEEIKIQFDAAATEEEKESLRAEYHETMKGIEEQGATAMRIWREYEKALENGNERLDLNDCIWDKDVKNLIDCIRENGITEFTFSSGWSGAVDTAWLFQQNGCILAGLIEINGGEKAFSEEREKLHAYLFKVN